MQNKTSENAPLKWDDLFYENLLQCLESVSQRFPENTAIIENLSSIKILKGMKHTFRTKWREFSAGHIKEIMTCDSVSVCKIFDECESPILSSLGLSNMLLNPKVEIQTKESIWKFIHVLTTISHAGTDTEIPKDQLAVYNIAAEASLKTQKQMWEVMQNSATPQAPSTSTSAPADATKTAAAPGGATTRPNMKETFEAMIDSMPKFMKQFNEMMKDSGEENYLGNLARQFANPGQLQPGFENNIAANVMAAQSPNTTLMDETQRELQQQELKDENGSPVTVEYLLARHKRLEKIEKARAKRQTAGKKSGR